VESDAGRVQALFLQGSDCGGGAAGAPGAPAKGGAPAPPPPMPLLLPGSKQK